MSEDIHFEINGRDAMKELNRLSRLPYGGGKYLDMGLKMAKEEIRSEIHVMTGKLKSRVSDSHHQVGKVWEGKITVGRGLGYAVYEKDRDGVKVGTGTPHDFFLAAYPAVHATLLAAMMNALEG